MPVPTPPRLRQIANLWTLWDHPSGEQEWSLERKIAAIREAGFDGFACQLEHEHGKLARKYGLLTVGFISSGNSGELTNLIARNRDAGARRINIQLGDHDTPLEEATAMAIRTIEEGARLGVDCDIEVHRDTCTETPEKTYAIATAYQRQTGRLLPITWDFSHFAVVKHLAPPFWGRLLERPELVRHSRQFHFRPFNGHHCQIPVTDGQGRLTSEFEQWLPVVAKTFDVWLDGNPADVDLYVCPEMGPVRGGYNLVQLPDSWSEAKVLRGILGDTWRRALSGRAAAPDIAR